MNLTGAWTLCIPWVTVTAEVLEGDVSETLETQLENFAGMMRGGYENMASLTEIPENVSDFGAYVAEQIGKPFNRWETLQDPNVSQLMAANKDFSNKADALTWISAALNIAGAVSRVEQWSDSYVGQLQTLGELIRTALPREKTKPGESQKLRRKLMKIVRVFPRQLQKESCGNWEIWLERSFWN